MSLFSTSRFPPLLLSDDTEVLTAPRRVADISDEEMLAKISAGDREALAQLFRRHGPTVLAIGRRILRNATEAEDLVQDVFLYVFKKSCVYDSSKGPARSWLFQVTYTQALLRRRKLNSHGFYEGCVTEESRRCCATDESELAYESTVEALFGRSVWNETLQGLTDDQRETLRLHFFEGYTFAEIAEKLGQSYANVRHHHYRGLEKLRKHLTDDGWSRRYSLCYKLKSGVKSRPSNDASA